MSQTEKLSIETGQILQGHGQAPATCGELLQGQFHPGEDFLVTLPLEWYSNVEVRIHPTPGEASIFPLQKSKTKLAVRKLLARLSRQDISVEIKVESSIPEGKGLGSSTADITAACLAVGQALGIAISPEMISAVAAEIEPSDGSMYPQSVCYDHRRCELIEPMGTMPACSLLIVDLGGQIDTISFNQQPKAYTTEDCQQFRELFERLKSAFHHGCLAGIAAVAMTSARINQKVLHKPMLYKLINISMDSGAHGLCAAHSGTVVGLIFDRQANNRIEQAKRLIRQQISPDIETYTVLSR